MPHPFPYVWAPGLEIEYANGLRATVVQAIGAGRYVIQAGRFAAVTRDHDAETPDEPEIWSFATEGEEWRATLAEALADHQQGA